MAFKNFTKENHQEKPLIEALVQYCKYADVLPFDVPGHKKGASDHPMKEFLGDDFLKYDVNSMKQLDLLSNPVSVIKKAEALFADLYGADEAFFLVNGSTSGIHMMLMATLNPGDSIILPRNVHKSAITGLVLCGGYPVYMFPEYDVDYGISTNVRYEEAKRAMDENPDAKAIFLINPTYFGATAELDKIIEYAHDRDMIVIVDEAHGALLPFSDDLPKSAVHLGADLVTISIHKTAGSLTQSSVLLMNEGRVSKSKLRSTVNLLQTTSASYLLMSSLDGARYQLAKDGFNKTNELVKLSQKTIEKINAIAGLSCFSQSKIGEAGVDGFDCTKLTINVRGIGMTGFDAYEILRDKYKVQMELAETYSILAIVGIGDSEESLNQLVYALERLAIEDKKEAIEMIDIKFDPVYPRVYYSPRDAFYMDKEVIKLSDSIGKIAGENLMIYPPGIPVIILGERITQKTIDQYEFLYNHTQSLLGAENTHEQLTIKVVKNILHK